LEKDAFCTLIHAYLKAQKRGLTECALLKISVTREQAKAKDVEQKITKLLRTTDYLGELEDGKLYVLLSNTNKKGAQIVINRFEEIGYKAVYQEEIEL
jgi:hypothetical protein